MADLSRPLFDFASELETETAKLNACFGLMREALQFSYNDPKQAAQAQERLLFLTSAIDSTRGRLDAMTAAAYEVAFAEKAMA